jgi:hypothetical protein
MFVRKLLAFVVDQGSILVDVEEVPWHDGMSRQHRGTRPTLLEPLPFRQEPEKIVTLS